MRIVLANDSSKQHVVTLIYPNRVGATTTWATASARLSWQATAVAGAGGHGSGFPLLQPPLPSRGDGSIAVEVDGRHEGEVRAPNANNHCDAYSRSGLMGTVLISRSLDYDAVSHVFQSTSLAFTAAKATGAPDSLGGGSWNQNAWTPDTRSFGRTNWLDLDYSSPQIVDKISVHDPLPLPPNGFITLLGASGTNLLKLSMTNGASTFAGPTMTTTSVSGGRPRFARVRGSGMVTEFTLPATSQPVKTVHFDFGNQAPSSISIDAVGISGPSGTNQWASDARASSDNSAAAASFGSGGTPAEMVQSIRAESPVTEWSENWLAYTPFDAIVINGADFGALPPGVLNALGDYAYAGGNIVLLGKTELPALWHAWQTRPTHDGTEFEVGFGSVFAFGTENPAPLGTTSIQRMRDAVRDTMRYFQSLPEDGAAANALMPVVENLKIPTRGIVIIMLIFVIAIGPVNSIYLNRIKRRTWMLWTIPAISAATTLLVFAYSLLREGITPDTRIAGITALDQTSHRASTIGCEAFYCPLTPSSGLHFDFNTEATPLVNLGYGSGSPREVDWTQYQHFQHGWVSARVPEHFHLRKSETTSRERIQVLNEGGKLQIVNSLGAPIKSLWVADSNMNLFQANNVAPGEKGGLIPCNQVQPAEKSGVNGLLRDLTFTARLDSLGDNASKYLCPTPTSRCWTETRSSKTRWVPPPAPNAPAARPWCLESWMRTRNSPKPNESPGQKSAQRIRHDRGRG